jgi:hypothetical protein
MDFPGREGVELLVVRGVHGDELALQVRGQLADRDAVLVRDALQLIAIRLRLGRLLQVDAAFVPRGDLHADVAQLARPARDGLEVVERLLVAHELGEEDSRPFETRLVVHLRELVVRPGAELLGGFRSGRSAHRCASVG